MSYLSCRKLRVLPVILQIQANYYDCPGTWFLFFNENSHVFRITVNGKMVIKEHSRKFRSSSFDWYDLVIKQKLKLCFSLRFRIVRLHSTRGEIPIYLSRENFYQTFISMIVMSIFTFLELSTEEWSPDKYSKCSRTRVHALYGNSKGNNKSSQEDLTHPFVLSFGPLRKN